MALAATEPGVTDEVDASLYSYELEQSVLGGLLVAAQRRSEILNEVPELLRDTDFYHQAHQAIYRLFLHHLNHNLGTDVLSLQNALVSDTEAAQMPLVDGYLQMLVDNTPGVSHLLEHARAVQGLSVRRALVGVATTIAERARYPEGMRTDELVNEAEKSVLNVLSYGGSAVTELESSDQLLTGTLDAMERLYRDSASGLGLATGFPWLDKQTSGLQAGDLVVLAARPGIGKTSMAINILEYALTHQPGGDDTRAPMVLFSMEMPGVQIMRRMLASLSSVGLQNIRSGKITEANWDSIRVVAEKVRDAPLYIDSSATLDVAKLRHRVRYAKSRHQADPALIVIDYLQLMNAVTRAGAREENRNQEISGITRGLKGVAKEFACPVLLLSQLTRNPQHADRRPALVDLRDSGAIEQDADLVLFLHKRREEMPDEHGRQQVELIIGKHRNGPVGRCDLSFLGDTTKFTESASEDWSDEGVRQQHPRRSDAIEDVR